MTQAQKDPKLENPFRIREGQPFVFASTLHRRCFQQLYQTVNRSRNLQVVLGGPGTGKSTILQLLAAYADDALRVIFCDARHLEQESLLTFLSKRVLEDDECDTGTVDFASFLGLVKEHCPDNESLLFLIDEAQGLSDTELESALELADAAATDRGSFTVVMAGMPGLERRIEASANHPSLANASVYTLTTLGAFDIREFIVAQLRQAGYADNTFSSGAIQTVASSSHGIPRLINRICSNALVRANISGENVVSQLQAEEAGKNLPSAHVHDESSGDRGDVVKPFKVRKAGKDEHPEHGSISNAQTSPAPLLTQLPANETGLPETPALSGRDDADAAHPDLAAEPVESEPSLDDPGRVDEQKLDPAQNQAHKTVSEGNLQLEDERTEARRHWTKMVAAGLITAIVVGAGVTYKVFEDETSESTDLPVERPQSTTPETLGKSNPEIRVENPTQDADKVPSIAAGDMAWEASQSLSPQGTGGPGLHESSSEQSSMSEGADPDIAEDSTSRAESRSAGSDRDAARTERGLDTEAGSQAFDGERAKNLIEMPSNDTVQTESHDVDQAAAAGVSDSTGPAAPASSTPSRVPTAVEGTENGDTARKVSEHTEKAKQALQNDAFETATEQVNMGLSLDSDNRELKALAEAIETERKIAKEREQISQQVEGLRRDARSLLATGSFQNALARVDDALELAPAEEIAGLQALRSEIEDQLASVERLRNLDTATRLSEEALAALTADDFDNALSLTNEALDLLPDNEALLLFLDRIEAEKAAAAEQSRPVEKRTRLMEEARSLLQADE